MDENSGSRKDSGVNWLHWLEVLSKLAKIAKRVSAEATEVMTGILEGYASNIARKATELSRYAGRRTVKAEDVKLALKQ